MSGDDSSVSNWARYQHEVDLHRSYLDLVIKINAFYYAVTGAIVSFYFLHIDKEPLLKFSLILPLIMTIALAVFYFRAANAADISQKNIELLTKNLDFEVGSVVAAVLAFLLRVFFWLFLISAVGLFILLVKDYNISCLFVLSETPN